MRALLSVLFLVVGCGQVVAPTPIPTPPPTPIEPRIEARVLVWGASWCSTCKQALPEVNAALNKLSNRDLVSFEVFVPTGANSSDRPTLELAKKYVEFLKLDAVAMVDEWYWRRYQSYFGGSIAIPAGVLLGADGAVRAKWPAGSLDAAEVARKTKQLLP